MDVGAAAAPDAAAVAAAAAAQVAAAGEPPPEWVSTGELPAGWVLEPDSRGMRELGEQRRLIAEHAQRSHGRGLGEVARRELSAALVREASQYGRVSYVRAPPSGPPPIRW